MGWPMAVAAIGTAVIGAMASKQRTNEANTNAANAASLEWERQLHSQWLQNQYQTELNNTNWAESKAAAAQAQQFSMASAKQQQQAAQAMADISWKRQIDLYKKRYQITVRDMKAAGLNPILAAGGGFNVGSGLTAPVPSAGQASAYQARGSAGQAGSGNAPRQQTFMHPLIGGDISNSAANFARTMQQLSQVEKTQSEIAKIGEETKFVTQQVTHEMLRQIETRARTEKITKEEQEIVHRTNNLVEQFNKIGMEIQVLDADLQLKNASSAEKRARMREIDAKVGQLRAITKQINMEQKKVKTRTDVYETQYGKILGYLRAFTEAINLNVGGAIMKAFK